MAARDSYFTDLSRHSTFVSGRGCILPVGHQGGTDSCYAFALVDIIYSSLYIHGGGEGVYLDLEPELEDMEEIWGLYKGSVQELLDCVHLEYPPPLQFLTGATQAGVKNTLQNIISFIVEYGVSLERNCPFLGFCRQFRSLSDGYQPYKPRIYIQSGAMRLQDVDAQQLTDSEIKNLTELICAHPIGMGIIATPSFSAWNGRDIYHGPTPEERDEIKKGAVDNKEFVDYGNHIVVLVDSGVDENGNTYFLAKNSWGVEWGYKGFIKLSAKIPPPFYEVVVELTKRPSITVRPFPPPWIFPLPWMFTQN